MKRNNLLITSVGKIDCIPSWLSNDRNFDIALIYFPNDIEDDLKMQLEDYADFLFFESGFKYSILKSVFNKNPSLLEYDYFWMPDDDIKLITGTTNQLFDLARENKLKLCQPSTTKKNISWKIVRNNPKCELRYTNYVEVMCPLFSKEALLMTLDSFSYTSSGWGLDFYWCKLIKSQIAIIDRVKVFHTKKIQLEGGALYEKLLRETGKEPHEELDEMIEKYNLDPVPREIGRVYKKGGILYFIYKMVLGKELVIKKRK